MMAGSDTSSESEYYDLDDDGQLQLDEQMLMDGSGEGHGPNEDIDELGNPINYDIGDYFSKDDENDLHIPYDYKDDDDDDEEHQHIQPTQGHNDIDKLHTSIPASANRADWLNVMVEQARLIQSRHEGNGDGHSNGDNGLVEFGLTGDSGCTSNPIATLAKLPNGFIQHSLGYMGALFNTLQPSQDFDTIRRRFLQKVQGIINDAFGRQGFETPQVRLFGSSCNGLGLDDSDVDITILLPPTANIYTHPCTNMILLSQIFERAGMQNVAYIINATVPICKFHDPEFNLTADINTHNLLGLENTKLIHIYLQIDKRLELVIRLVKYWAKRRGMNDTALDSGENRTLSSYAYVLMVINFFQVRRILPSLQEMVHDRTSRFCNKTGRSNRSVEDLAGQATKFVNRLQLGNADQTASSSSSSSSSSNNNKPQVVVVYAPVGIPRPYIRFLSSARAKASSKRYAWDISFEDIGCSCGAVKKLLKKNVGKQNSKIQKDSIGLFYEFLKYYGWEYEYSKKRVISVRTGRVLDTLPPDLSSSKKKKCFLVIEDPFQLDRNIGATLFSHGRLQ
ncbi:hypothetical protein HDU76_009105, partial [Blyttiomyces sp. JEL0837]